MTADEVSTQGLLSLSEGCVLHRRALVSSVQACQQKARGQASLPDALAAWRAFKLQLHAWGGCMDLSPSAALWPCSVSKVAYANMEQVGALLTGALALLLSCRSKRAR
eukprot:3894378-Amphidinium_carterae.1